jgi:hypothetical protein
VLQFLTHEGYTETARAFADEVHEQRTALNIGPEPVANGLDVKEDENAGHRQRTLSLSLDLLRKSRANSISGIRAAILEGDVEKAIKHTNAFYPDVLRDHETIYFHLRCRKFIEMIRHSASFRPGAAASSSNNSFARDATSTEMELDDFPQDPQNSQEREAMHLQLLHEALEYGKGLEEEFKNDVRREVKKSLQEAYSLLAYEDPLGAPEVSHLLAISGREKLAEEVNSAILGESFFLPFVEIEVFHQPFPEMSC